MAFDEILARRIRDVLADQPGIVEKKMFGGLTFMLNGNMCCGIVKNDLMVRVGPDQHGAALAAPHASPMQFTGRPMRGMVMVAPAGFESDRDLGQWIGRALQFVEGLPAK